MQYLLTEIVLFLILAYGLGLVTGRVLWHRATTTEGADKLKRKLADSQSTVRNLQRRVDTLQASRTSHAPVPTSEPEPARPASLPRESGPRPMSPTSGPAAAAFLDDVADAPPAPPPAPLPEPEPIRAASDEADPTEESPAEDAPAEDTPNEDAPAVEPPDDAVPAPESSPETDDESEPEGGPTYDDLQRISGIGPVIEQQLAELGVTTYRQIARFTDDDIERIGRHLDVFPDRVRRERWVQQAATLHRETYGTTP